MKVTASIRMLDSGRFEATCKTLSVPLQEGRTFGQVLEDLSEAIKKEFIAQFYAGKDPGHIEIEPTAMSAALTFSLDRETNHSIFEFGCTRRTPAPAQEEREAPVIDVTPAALPPGRSAGWAPMHGGATYHYYDGNTALCGSHDLRSGPHRAVMPAGIPPFDSPACKDCLALLTEAARADTEPVPETPEDGEGWATSSTLGRWHYYRDGHPACGAEACRTGDMQTWPPVYGACDACLQALLKEEMERQNGGPTVPYEADEAMLADRIRLVEPAADPEALDQDERAPDQMVGADEDPADDQDDGREGWAPEALYPNPSGNNGRWHYYRDGVPACGNANPRSGDLQTWPPAAGACAACIEVLHREELPPIPGHEGEEPISWRGIESPMGRLSPIPPDWPTVPAEEAHQEETAPPHQKIVLGWGRMVRQEPGPYHALDPDGMAICGRMKTPIAVSTDHPEEGERVCKICRGLVGADEESEEGDA